MGGGPNCQGRVSRKGARGWGQEGWGKGDGARGGVRGARGVESIF